MTINSANSYRVQNKKGDFHAWLAAIRDFNRDIVKNQIPQDTPE